MMIFLLWLRCGFSSSSSSFKSKKFEKRFPSNLTKRYLLDTNCILQRAMDGVWTLINFVCFSPCFAIGCALGMIYAICYHEDHSLDKHRPQRRMSKDLGKLTISFGGGHFGNINHHRRRPHSNLPGRENYFLVHS